MDLKIAGFCYHRAMTSPSRIPRGRALLFQGLTVTLAAGLLFPALDLHRAFHERTRAEAEARIACPHERNAPDHVEAAVEVAHRPCMACLFGLTSLADGLAGATALPRPAKGGLATSAVTALATTFSVRLPASRAPPLL